MPEQICYGWESLAYMFDVSTTTMRKKKQELLAAGVIFYKKRGGSNLKRLCFFESTVKAWIARKAASGEDFL